ncbi:MAG: hypothetical protein EZS28_009853 [Streblomastix strix]|uniref:Uncharacterized protein n=1 Tax=Streblomastix strix TaxID=222440 RepID=A0A5J4WK06_9EUKA|nr:MAG: hypothetical protein EZS28_009853 [Streblomastix strix]
MQLELSGRGRNRKEKKELKEKEKEAKEKKKQELKLRVGLMDREKDGKFVKQSKIRRSESNKDGFDIELKQEECGNSSREKK